MAKVRPNSSSAPAPLTLRPLLDERGFVESDPLAEPVTFGPEADAVIAELRSELRALRASYDDLRREVERRNFERPPHY